MTRKMAALLAAILILTLTACNKPQEPEKIPETSPTQEEVIPQEPNEEVDDEDEDDLPTEVSKGDAIVLERHVVGTVEEAVSYEIWLPQISAKKQEVTQIFQDYYQMVEGKLVDLAWGELYEDALNQHTVMKLDCEFDVERNEKGILSILRTMERENMTTGVEEVTYAAETFSLENGGLMTTDDFFTVEESVYRQRLAKCVTQEIKEDPYHANNYYEQWESLVESAWDKAQFFVTEDEFCVFYQEGQLGKAAETVFEIDLTELADILK